MLQPKDTGDNYERQSSLIFATATAIVISSPGVRQFGGRSRCEQWLERDGLNLETYTRYRDLIWLICEWLRGCDPARLLNHRDCNATKIDSGVVHFLIYANAEGSFAISGVRAWAIEAINKTVGADSKEAFIFLAQCSESEVDQRGLDIEENGLVFSL